MLVGEPPAQARHHPRGIHAHFLCQMREHEREVVRESNFSFHINTIDNGSSPTAAWQVKLLLATRDIVTISFKIYGGFYLRGPKYFTSPCYGRVPRKAAFLMKKYILHLQVFR